MIACHNSNSILKYHNSIQIPLLVLNCIKVLEVASLVYKQATHFLPQATHPNAAIWQILSNRQANANTICKEGTVVVSHGNPWPFHQTKHSSTHACCPIVKLKCTTLTPTIRGIPELTYHIYLCCLVSGTQ